MYFPKRTHFLLIFLGLFSLPGERSAGDPLPIRDGERIVFLGSTFMERESDRGYIETILTRRFPHRSIRFRNLGYSGETVFGESRAMFDTPEKGWERMVRQVLDASPTLLFIAFGSNAAYEGTDSIPRFVDAYRHLIEVLEASTEARIVLLSPPALEDLGPPLPDPSPQNERVEEIVNAVRALADEKTFRFVDLYRPLLKAYEEDSLPWTDNTIHFNPYGYWRLALFLEKELGWAEKDLKVVIDLREGRFDASGTRFDSIHADETAGVELLLTDTRLPIPDPPRGQRTQFEGGPLPYRVLFVDGLPGEKYELRVGENGIGTYTAKEFSEGIPLPLGPQKGQVERLRKTIRKKNRYFFYRWRPQNWTYLYGFRRHEQGQNAKETPMFDPLVRETEISISTFKIPETYRVEIVPIEGGDAR